MWTPEWAAEAFPLLLAEATRPGYHCMVSGYQSLVFVSFISRGKRIRIAKPCGLRLPYSSLPPRLSVQFLTMESPRPVPPGWVVEACPR